MDKFKNNSNVTISAIKTEYLDGAKLLYIEVTPKSKSIDDFDYILVKNFYTHTINIVQFANEKWKCVLGEYKLMADPDCDEDGEKYSVIYKKQLEENGFNESAEIFRFYLTQESPYWNLFTLKEIKFIKEEENEGIKYNTSTSRFDFPNLTLLHDREEINQKYIEIMKTNGREFNLSIFK